jgi:hypothetical protein
MGVGGREAGVKPTGRYSSRPLERATQVAFQERVAGYARFDLILETFSFNTLPSEIA